MKLEKFPTVLTIVNLGLLLFLVLQIAASAQPHETLPVVRAHLLEIVDDHGRVRASIKVEPAETFKPTGKDYPETVVLRLIDANGRPEVKIVASEQGGGLSFVGDNDATQVLLGAERTESSLKLTNKDGNTQLLKP